ncbi:MAG TPA: aldo/keto reductase [Jatrophihabitans sp.]|uniref:aldo/keto reductase n=1 Tax=Jatrophihabitans sp. TaxID=1932789 RepID=UPI002DFC5A1E|nr:aldo/keto reductase [Jatrophihabitans sp.]
MKQRTVGRSGLKVSHLGLGTMTWGIETDADEAAAQLVAFHDAGGTLVDTAASYGYGESEAMLGQLMADVVPRVDLTIATKAGITRTPEGRIVDASRGMLLRRLDESLRKLGTDWIDLWYVHYVDDSVPFDETLAALDHAVSSGKVRYVGVSNYCGWRLGRAAGWQQAVPGRAPIVANQVRYSLLDRGIEREVVPACDALGVGVMPYSPLGGGVLTGKYRDGVPADSRAAASRTLPLDDSAGAAGIVEAVATAAEGLATSSVSVALAWLRDRPGVVAPILGARTLGQLTAALASEALELPREIVSALDDVSAPAIEYPEDVR